MKSKAQKAVDQYVQESNDSTQILPEPSEWVQSKQTENTNPSILGTPRVDKITIYNMSFEQASAYQTMYGTKLNSLKQL